MTDELNTLEKQLCNILQTGLDPVERPFAKIGKLLGISEEAVLAEIRILKEIGIIRRIAASIDYRALGRVSVLVTASVPGERIEEIAAKVSEFEGVSHNYQRDHAFNLWFTLQAEGETNLYKMLAQLNSTMGVTFYAMPAKTVYKLDVRFDAFSNGQSLLRGDEPVAVPPKPVKLKMDDEALLAVLQHDIELVGDPFSHIPGLELSEALESLRRLLSRGVLRRLGAVVDYRKLGFAANAMAVFAVDDSIVDKTGAALAKSNSVSHCYCRKTFKGWPYNLFGMMHGHDMAALQKKAGDFAKQNDLRQFELLTTVKEFKKKPVVFKKL